MYQASNLRELLIILTNYHGGYRTIREKLLRYRYPEKITKQSSRLISDNTLRVTLSRLQKKGFVKNENKIWNITARGRMYLQTLLPSHSKNRKSNKEKTMIIIFDIPEKQQRKRQWLRIELRNLGFNLLQKSVWFGPALLPRTFIRSLHELNLLPYLKFFTVKSQEIL
jgi:DNA-binding transcriptional regulator PaaX